ncbi:MAG: endonuclease NucS domain-containing protein [Promethearchaeati archaeon SRVP18_Atabeyarchaeia-1]
MLGGNTYRYILYVKDSISAHSTFGNVLSALRDLEKKEKNIRVEVIDVSALTDVQRERITADIRTIPPQTRGRVVSGGGMTLALSGSKNLNLSNTPILVVRDSSDRPVAVFPHALEEKVETVQQHLSKALEKGSEEALHETRFETEELLTELLSLAPSIIEEDLTVIGKEQSTPTGTIDLLLLDRNGTPVVAEVEVTATEQAVGQVCKLAEGYAEFLRQQADNKGSKEREGVKVRKAIVCIKIRGMIHQACRSAGVELYQVRAEPSRFE